MKTQPVFSRTFRQRLVRMAALGVYSALIVLLCASESSAQIDENAIKATFVLRVAEFVSWRGETLSDPESEVVIGVLGKVSFQAQLATLSKRRPAGGHPLRVRQLQPGESFADCHVLFFGDMDRDEMNGVLSRVRRDAVLTVSESADFADRGGIINIRFERNPSAGGGQNPIAIRFSVNTMASERAGLMISSRLLQVATLVGDNLDGK